MSVPVVGIAIPAYRATSTLEETLRSCVNQTLRDWVAFVTVDGDDAAEEQAIVRRLGDERIRLRVNRRRLGQYWNFNRAMLASYEAGARWIKPLCADDILYPDALERLLAQETTCGLAYGYYDVIDEQGNLTALVDLSRTASQTYRPGEFIRDALPVFNPVGGPSSVMLSRDAFERCGGFDDRFPWAADQILWYRIARAFGVSVIGERPILQYREHQNTVTSTMAFSSNRFSDPVNLGRDISLSAQPPSREWLLSQHACGQAMGAAWLTSAALLRRGLIREAIRGVHHSTAQARVWWFPFAADFLFKRLVLQPLGIARRSALAPPIVRAEPKRRQ